MRKGKKNRFLIFLGLLLISLGMTGAAQAEVEWRTLSTKDLDKKPLDVASSADGKSLFVLTSGEVQIFSPDGKSLRGNIPVDAGVDQIAVSPRGDQLILTNEKTNKLSVVSIDFVQQIDVKGSPFKGKANAPVVVAVFSDYQ